MNLGFIFKNKILFLCVYVLRIVIKYSKCLFLSFVVCYVCGLYVFLLFSLCDWLKRGVGFDFKSVDVV